MAMYLTSKDGCVGRWYVGTPPPYGSADDIIRVQADGDELQSICALLPGLTVHKAVALYFGDHARLIAANVCNMPVR